MAYSQSSQAVLKATYGSSADEVRTQLQSVLFDFGGTKVSMNVHKKVADAFEAVCKDYRAKVKTGKAPAYNLKAGYCGSFNWRNIKRTDGSTSPNLSMHSFGIAVDFNAWNPNGQGSKAKSDIPAELVKSMNKYGFYWGGDWGGATRDPMHFEYAPASFSSVSPSGGTKPAPSGGVPAYPGYPLKAKRDGNGNPIGVGSTGPAVTQWQKKMKSRGWTIEVDGKFGKNSDAVARKFQREKGLTVDGIVGKLTWQETWTAPK